MCRSVNKPSTGLLPFNSAAANWLMENDKRTQAITLPFQTPISSSQRKAGAFLNCSASSWFHTLGPFYPNVVWPSGLQPFMALPPFSWTNLPHKGLASMRCMDRFSCGLGRCSGLSEVVSSPKEPLGKGSFSKGGSPGLRTSCLGLAGIWDWDGCWPWLGFQRENTGKTKGNHYKKREASTRGVHWPICC